MNSQSGAISKALTVKDLVTTGIFSALFLVFTLIGGGFFAVNPILTFYTPIGSALLCGPVYLLLIAKVPKRWSITVLGVLTAAVWHVTGMHWAFSLGYFCMAVAADAAAGLGKYRNAGLNTLSYMLMSLGGIYTYVVYFADPEGWAGTMLKSGTDQSYIDAMRAASPSWLPAVIVSGTLLAAAFSAWAGRKMLKRQFERAGITA